MCIFVEIGEGPSVEEVKDAEFDREDELEAAGEYDEQPKVEAVAEDEIDLDDKDPENENMLDLDGDGDLDGDVKTEEVAVEMDVKDEPADVSPSAGPAADGDMTDGETPKSRKRSADSEEGVTKKIKAEDGTAVVAVPSNPTPAEAVPTEDAAPAAVKTAEGSKQTAGKNKKAKNDLTPEVRSSDTQSTALV